MLNDFDGKQDTPYGVDDETSTAADEMEDRPESICGVCSALALLRSTSIDTQLLQQPQSHDKKVIQPGKKKEPLAFM